MISGSKLILKDIYKTYNGKKVLDIDRKEVPLKGIIAVVGWSGSGKSTFLNILSLIDHPDVGIRGITPTIEFHLPDHTYIVKYHGKSTSPEISKIDRNGNVKSIDENRFRRHVFGFVFQEHYLHPNLNINYNIKTPLFTRQKTVSPKKLVNTCKMLGIDEHLKSFPNKISGGQAQRASILRGLLKNAPILFGDELTSNLDHDKSDEILGEVRNALDDEDNRLHSFFWVSHDIHLIKEYAQHIITIKSGKIECTEHNFETFEAIMDLLREGRADTAKENNNSMYPFKFKPKNANIFELFSYYFSYAYNDLFKGYYRPSVDFIVVVLSLSFVILFLCTIFKISYASNRFLELKLSDPRINFIEVRANEKVGELGEEHFEELNNTLEGSIRFMTPVYYATTFIKDLDIDQFRSNSNAITFRRGDPIILEILGEDPAPFITSEKEWEGLVFRKDRAEKFGYGEKAGFVIASFNNFNKDKGDKEIALRRTEAQLPFNKTMMMREEFYIENYKKSSDEEKPPMAFIVVYPKNIHDTIQIKDKIEEMGSFEIVDAFKVKNKIAIIDEIKKQTELFTWLSIGAITIISAIFVGVTIYRSIHKKKKEIGVFLAFGMRKSSIHIFYLCEALIIIAHTLVISFVAYHFFIERLINKMVTQGTLIKVVDSVEVNSVIKHELLQIPTLWMVSVYSATYVFLTILFTFLIFRITSQKPVRLIRDI